MPAVCVTSSDRPRQIELSDHVVDLEFMVYGDNKLVVDWYYSDNGVDWGPTLVLDKAAATQLRDWLTTAIESDLK